LGTASERLIAKVGIGVTVRVTLFGRRMTVRVTVDLDDEAVRGSCG
jgi:hypothetical protein